MQADDFTEETIRRIDARRDRTIANPVIDRWRFRERQFTPSTAQSMDAAVGDLRRNAARYNELAASLNDEASVETLRQLMMFRVLGQHRFALPLSAEVEDAYRQSEAMRIGSSERKFPPFDFSTYRVPSFFGQSIELEAWLGNIVCSFAFEQYFYNRAETSIRPGAGDIVIDAGACFGDTALAFAAASGKGGKVYSFDPTPAHQETFLANVARNPVLAPRIELVGRALSDVADQSLRFKVQGAGSRFSNEGDIVVTTETIDRFVEQGGLKRVDFIKMDIEGAERSALAGARRTIERFKPKLAISVYHSIEDLLTIPHLIRTMNPGYKLFLGHYTNHLEETILYAA